MQLTEQKRLEYAVCKVSHKNRVARLAGVLDFGVSAVWQP